MAQMGWDGEDRRNLYSASAPRYCEPIPVAIYSADEEFINKLKTNIELRDNLSWAGVIKNHRHVTPTNCKVWIIDLRQPTRQHFTLLTQFQITTPSAHTLCVINNQDAKHIFTAFDLGVRNFATDNIAHIITTIHSSHHAATILPTCILTQLITLYRNKTIAPRSLHAHSTLTPRSLHAHSTRTTNSRMSPQWSTHKSYRS